jgi:prolyl oligopeptidase
LKIGAAARPAAAIAALCAACLSTPAMSDSDDPHLWLEDVQGERALAWVRERNRASEARLTAWPEFEAVRSGVREVLDSKAQIPYPQRRGAWLYNLWRDAANPRGLWRRATLDEFRKPEPAWETVLDVDALGRAEGRNWVWAGAECLAPDYRRCLVSLSLGGADASVVREFDTVDKRFVDGGFAVPEAKTGVSWIDADRIYLGTDTGPGSLTDSGYPRLVKILERGQPIADARTVFEGERGDVGTYASYDPTPGFERHLITRLVDFYNQRQYIKQGERWVEIGKPLDAQVGFWRQWMVFTLRSDWALAGRRFPAGALLVADAAAWLAGERKPEMLFEPTPTRSLAGWGATRDTLLVTVLDNVASRIEEWRAAGGRWQRRDVAAPFPGALSAAPLHDPLMRDDPLAEHWLLNTADFLAPDALELARTGSDRRERLKARPAFFGAEGMRVEQRFATSMDGTRVPYFIVWPRGAKEDGENPTLLYGYGGFEVSMQPYYSGSQGRGWTSRGGVFVLANIRGGGEFGPAWHQAALGPNRQKSFDDFIAVAEDLTARRVTRPQRLGIQGGSNGGLLVGAVMVQRPELFGAVVCEVPLLDMRRYTKLLAGASWIAEYGDPEQPGQWAGMQRWSPYQNVPPATERRLPPVLLVTSTRDDRVHPGHARKMAARLAERGQPVLYWENIEGGHGGAADNAQRAQMTALEYAFLWQTLGAARQP